MLALTDKIMAFHKINASVNEKLFALHSKYNGLQDNYSGLEDEHTALAKCLVPDGA